MFETCEPSFVTNNTLLPEAICCLLQCNQLKTDVLLITIYCLGLFFVVYKNEIPYNRFLCVCFIYAYYARHTYVA